MLRKFASCHASAIVFAFPFDAGDFVAYIVSVDDNAHYMDASRRSRLGEFDRYAEALKAAQARVDDFLSQALRTQPGMSATKLYESWTTFGEDPFIVATAPSPEIEPRFSAKPHDGRMAVAFFVASFSKMSITMRAESRASCSTRWRTPGRSGHRGRGSGTCPRPSRSPTPSRPSFGHRDPLHDGRVIVEQDV